MYQSKNIAGRIFPLALVILLAACSPAAPAQTTPTVDANMIYTAAAQTVQAQLTQSAALTPSATATQEATATLSIPTADSSLPTLALPGSSTQSSTVQPIATLTPIGLTTQSVNPPASAKVFQWISNDPADGTVINAGTKFDIVWTVKNTGTTAWNTSYSYAYFSGDKYFDHLRYNLKDTVNAGATVKVIVDATAPTKSGTYYTWWKMVNDQGQNIGDMDLKITVVQPGETPTVTATP